MKFVIIIFSLFMMFGGLFDTYKSYRNPKPIDMKVSEFVRSDKSDLTYVNLTDANVSLLKAVAASGLGGVSRLYVQIESESYKQEDKISLILNTVDDEIIDLADKMFSLPQSEQLKFMIKNKDKLVIKGQISGRVMHSDSMESNRKEEMLKLMDKLDKDFYFLNHNGHPSKVRGPVMFLIGLIMFVLAFRVKKPS